MPTTLLMVDYENLIRLVAARAPTCVDSLQDVTAWTRALLAQAGCDPAETQCHVYLDTHDARVRRAYAQADYRLHCTPQLGHGKNAADSALTIDVCAALANGAATVIVISHDSDFSPLIQHVQRAGGRVVLGTVGHGMSALVRAADAHIDLLPILGHAPQPATAVAATTHEIRARLAPLRQRDGCTDAPMAGRIIHALIRIVLSHPRPITCAAAAHALRDCLPGYDLATWCGLGSLRALVLRDPVARARVGYAPIGGGYLYHAHHQAGWTIGSRFARLPALDLDRATVKLLVRLLSRVPMPTLSATMLHAICADLATLLRNIIADETHALTRWTLIAQQICDMRNTPVVSVSETQVYEVVDRLIGPHAVAVLTPAQLTATALRDLLWEDVVTRITRTALRFTDAERSLLAQDVFGYLPAQPMLTDAHQDMLTV